MKNYEEIKKEFDAIGGTSDYIKFVELCDKHGLTDGECFMLMFGIEF